MGEWAIPQNGEYGHLVTIREPFTVACGRKLNPDLVDRYERYPAGSRPACRRCANAAARANAIAIADLAHWATIPGLSTVSEECERAWYVVHPGVDPYSTDFGAVHLSGIVMRLAEAAGVETPPSPRRREFLRKAGLA